MPKVVYTSAVRRMGVGAAQRATASADPFASPGLAVSRSERALRPEPARRPLRVASSVLRDGAAARLGGRVGAGSPHAA